MASYKVLRSVAHNFAHSFVSVMNYHRDDYVMCHLLRRAQATKMLEFRLDVLKRMAGPLELLTRPIIESAQGYCSDFGRLVTSSGAALDMVSLAVLTLKLRPSGSVPDSKPSGRGYVDGTMRIVDVRGRAYLGRAIETY